MASQVKKRTGTVVVAGTELASRTRSTTSRVAHMATDLGKATMNVTKGAVKGTGKAAGKAVKGTSRGARGVLGGLRMRRNDSDDDESYSDSDY